MTTTDRATTVNFPSVELKAKENHNGNGRNAFHEVEQLALLLGPTDSMVQYEQAETEIPFQSINRLLQPRKTFEDIHQLGNNIMLHGLRSRLQVAMFCNETVVRQYLFAVNHIWKGTHKFDDLIVGEWQGKKAWFILISGERRWRAHADIWENGCDVCVEKYGKEPPGTCFARHIPSGKIKVLLCIDIPPREAIHLQYSENTYMPLPKDEEAEAYYVLWKAERISNPRLTLAAFGREINRSEEVIRNAIRFCELPLQFIEAVRKKEIVYGVALELARLWESGSTEEELTYWMRQTIFSRWKVDELREKVTCLLRTKNSGQISLLEMMTQEQTGVTRRLQMRKVVAREIIMAVWAWIHYFDVVLSYLKEDKVGKDESPFSIRSPVRMFKALAERQKIALPLLEKHLSAASYEECSQSIQEFSKMLPALEAAAPSEGTAEELGLLTLPSYAKG